MLAKAVLIALPNRDFDPSVVAISWQLLRVSGLRVRFASADGQAAVCDPLILSGEGLDPWARVPGLRRLKLLGLLLRARRDAYARLLLDSEFRQPLRKISGLHRDSQATAARPGWFVMATMCRRAGRGMCIHLPSALSSCWAKDLLCVGDTALEMASESRLRLTRFSAARRASETSTAH